MLGLKKNISFFFKRNSFLGTIGLYFKISRKLLILKLFESIKKNYFSRYNWTIQIIKKQGENTSRIDINLAAFYFLTKKVREIYQNSISKEFFFLTPNQLKRYNYSPIRKAIFN